MPQFGQLQNPGLNSTCRDTAERFLWQLEHLKVTKNSSMTAISTIAMALDRNV